MNKIYKVRIILETNSSTRIDQVRIIRDWVNEQIGWAENRFEIKTHSSGGSMDVWFEDSKDATLFSLRWV